MSDQEVKFDLDEVEKTFTKYRLNQILDGVVVLKRENGVIFNIGGKLDAFISATDFEDFSQIKFGDRFKAVITNMKNEDGLIEVSKTKADNLILGTMQASGLKLGKTFSFVVTNFDGHNFQSKLGEFEIIIPKNQILTNDYTNPKQFLNKKFDAIVTDIDAKAKQITASVKMLQERTKKNIELSFWNSIFEGKQVIGKVVKLFSYGALIDVYGVNCFCHISQIAHERVDDISKFLQNGKEYTFKVIEVNKETKKVSLSLKALQLNSKQEFLKNLEIGKQIEGKVVRILPFGAIIKDNQSGYEGLLHISDASAVYGTQIKDIIKLGEEIIVLVKNIDLEKQKISFELKEKRWYNSKSYV